MGGRGGGGTGGAVFTGWYLSGQCLRTPVHRFQFSGTRIRPTKTMNKAYNNECCTLIYRARFAGTRLEAPRSAAASVLQTLAATSGRTRRAVTSAGSSHRSRGRSSRATAPPGIRRTRCVLYRGGLYSYGLCKENTVCRVDMCARHVDG